MSKQPEALRMADQLDRGWAYKTECAEAAAELRRLHAECNDLARQLNESNERNGRLIAQRDALLEALKLIVQWDEAGLTLLDHHIERARAAIKQAEGEKT